MKTNRVFHSIEKVILNQQQNILDVLETWGMAK